MELAANFTLNNESLDAQFDISELENFDAIFELYAAGTTWGSISGDLSNQTDLINALNDKQDVLTAGDNIQIENNVISATDTTYTAGTGISIENGVISNTQTSAIWGNIEGTLSNQIDLQNALNSKQNVISDIDTIRNNAADGKSAYNTIQNYGDIVTYDAADFATSTQGNLADTAIQPGDNISELNNNAGYITSASLPTVNNASLTIQRNGSQVAVFTANDSVNKIANILVPTQASDIGALPSSTTINDLTTTAQQNAINSGATATNIGQITTNENNIADIRDLIPSQATSSNQLADKAFVNSSIATNTAYFIGTFNSVAELEAYSGPLTNNDYAFVATTDAAGNTLYDRYKYNADTQEWIFEYELNNSSFTAAQWDAINSGITDTDVLQIATNTTNIATKQDIINDLASIRSGASLGATSLQPNDNITELTNNAGYITGITNSDVITALGYTPYNSTNPNGYITGIISSDVTNALGYVPYNSTNPNGYITASALSGYATETWVNNQGFLTSVPTATTSSLGLVQPDGTTITINNGVISGASSVDIDNLTITENSNDELQAVGVIDQNNTTTAIKTWTGTKAQYDAIVTKDSNTLYNITDDTDVTLTLLEALYPVGSIYIGTMANCPLATLGVGTWQLKTSRFLVDKQEPTDSNPIGWNKYSDGYCEQFWKADSPSTINTTMQLPIAFKDTNYTVIGALLDYADLYICGITAYPATNSTFYALTSYNGTGYVIPCTWYACGYTTETTQFNQWERIS